MRKLSTWRLVWHFGGNAVSQDPRSLRGLHFGGNAVTRILAIISGLLTIRKLLGKPPSIQELRDHELII